MMRRIRSSAVAAAAVIFFQAGGAAAQQGQVIDRVAAVVEDRALLQSDLEMEYRRQMMQQQKTLSPEEESEFREEILNGMIADLLLAVHAEKIGVEVNEEMVEDEVDRALEENMRSIGGSAAFEKELDKVGMTLPQLKTIWREKIRARHLIVGLMRSEVLKDIQVTEKEIKEYYREHTGELPRRPRTISIAQILILMKADESSDEEALAKIRKVQDLIAGGADFARTAEEFSEGPSAKYGGSLGYLKLEDLGNPRFVEAVRKLTVGQVSGPVLTEHGYHIIKLEEVSGEQVKLRHILVKREENTEATEELAESIRRKILAGADFAEMAAEYSEDWNTRDNGGVVGEIPVTNLPEFFLDAVKDVGIGGIASLIQEDKGFRIIKVLGREEERVYTYEEAKEGLKEVIQSEKMQGKYEEYLADLKNLYYVDIKETGL